MCRAAGRSRRGSPSCSDAESPDGFSCPLPSPDLTPHERAALIVFQECFAANQWHFVGGDMSPARKVALRMSYAESAARSYGIAWTPAFRARLNECARSFLQYDAKVMAAEAENDKWQREHGGAVN